VPDGQKLPGVSREEKRIRFDYIKSQFFRTVHVDGIFGGLAPNGKSIRLSIWNERWPIPKQTVYETDELGNLVKEYLEERITREAIVREVDVDLVLDIECAQQIRDWLSERIEELIDLQKKRSELIKKR